MNTLGLVFIFLLIASIITTIILVYVFYIRKPSSVLSTITISSISSIVPTVAPTVAPTIAPTVAPTIAPVVKTLPVIKISPTSKSTIQPQPPPPSQKTSSPSIPSSPGTLTADGEPADEVARTGSALTIINTFRATLGKPPLKYYAEGTDCANKCAEYDNTNGFHKSKQGGIQCDFGASQNEGNNPQSQKQCIQMYIDEGPGGSHYDTITSERYTKISSGVFPKGNGRYFFTHNFYR